MFKVSRQAKIKEIILDRNQVDVQTLSSLLNVSSVTIRNDLEALEEQGVVIRTHGGAILNDALMRSKSPAASMRETQLEYDKYKDEIGQIASHLANENEWIFLGPGTTCSFLAGCLAQRNRLNIITNNLYAIPMLVRNSSNNIIVLGGSLYPENMFLGGDFFTHSLKNLHISKAFFSVSGVHLQGGYSMSSFAELNIYSQIREISSQVIFLADYRKFGTISLAKLGELDCVDTLISNEGIPGEYKTYFFEHGVRLYTSYEIKRSSVQGKD